MHFDHCIPCRAESPPLCLRLSSACFGLLLSLYVCVTADRSILALRIYVTRYCGCWNEAVPFCAIARPSAKVPAACPWPQNALKTPRSRFLLRLPLSFPLSSPTSHSSITHRYRRCRFILSLSIVIEHSLHFHAHLSDMMLFGKHFHRQELPWEVVDAKSVSPIPMWDEDEGKL